MELTIPTSYTPEKYLKEIWNQTEDAIGLLAEKNSLPYTENNIPGVNINLSGGNQIYDLNKPIQEVFAAFKGIDRLLLINAADVSYAGLKIKEDSIEPVPYFALLPEADGQKFKVEVQEAYFLDQCTEESIVRAFNSIKHIQIVDGMSPEETHKNERLKTLLQNIIKNSINYDDPTNEKELKAEKNLRENSKADSEGLNKAKLAMSFFKSNPESSLVFDTLRIYYTNQFLGGKKLDDSYIDKNAFLNDVKKLVNKHNFLKTAFNAISFAKKMTSPKFEIAAEKSEIEAKASREYNKKKPQEKENRKGKISHQDISTTLYRSLSK